MSVPIVSIVGRTDSGKTTVIEKLLPELVRRGYRVGTIKHHAHRDFEIDIPGKDTWRHKRAGAGTVAMIASGRMFVVRDTPSEISLDQALAMMGDMDLAITEGFRWAKTPKIEVVRAARDSTMLCSYDECLAVVTDLPMEAPIPILDLEDVAGLADVLERHLLGKEGHSG